MEKNVSPVTAELEKARRRLAVQPLIAACGVGMLVGVIFTTSRARQAGGMLAFSYWMLVAAIALFAVRGVLRIVQTVKALGSAKNGTVRQEPKYEKLFFIISAALIALLVVAALIIGTIAIKAAEA